MDSAFRFSQTWDIWVGVNVARLPSRVVFVIKACGKCKGNLQQWHGWSEQYSNWKLLYVSLCTTDQVERSPWDQFHTVLFEIYLWPSFVSSHVKAMLFRTHPTSAKASMSAPDLPSWGLFLWRPPLPPGHGLRQSMLPRRPQRGVARPGYSHRWDAWQGSRMGGILGPMVHWVHRG